MPAAAQASARPTLNGETLSASPSYDAPPYPFFLGQCGDGPANQTGPNFTFTGTATGPYPGTFTESGTVHYDGYLAPPSNRGPITSYSAHFTIRSQRTTITGRETMVTGGSAFCDGGAGGASVNIGPVNTDYTAMIAMPSGRRRVRGTSRVTIYEGFGLGQYWSATLSDQLAGG